MELFTKQQTIIEHFCCGAFFWLSRQKKITSPPHNTTVWPGGFRLNLSPGSPNHTDGAGDVCGTLWSQQETSVILTGQLTIDNKYVGRRPFWRTLIFHYWPPILDLLSFPSTPVFWISLHETIFCRFSFRSFLYLMTRNTVCSVGSCFGEGGRGRTWKAQIDANLNSSERAKKQVSVQCSFSLVTLADPDKISNPRNLTFLFLPILGPVHVQ